MNAIQIYRVGHMLYKAGIPILPKICKAIIRIIYNSVIDPATVIGKGSYLSYGGIAVVIHKRAIIGNNVIIGQNVTIGGRSKIHELPIIGNNVYIGAGAKVLGNVKIGNDVVIGANSVVIKDIPSHTAVAGVPAKVIKTNISFSDYL